jgi:hypothetical protein
MAQLSHASATAQEFCQSAYSRLELGFVEDVRSPSIVPKRQIKKAARDFAAAARDERYREAFETIRMLRDCFEPEAGRSASQVP